MKKLILTLIFVSSCAGFLTSKGLSIQDCITTHVKVITHNGSTLSEKMYDQVVEACTHMYDGRP